MTYFPAPLLASSSLLGNPTAIASMPISVAIDGSLSLSGGTLSGKSLTGHSTTGNYTLISTDNGLSLTSTDATPITYTLPTGLTGGFKARSYQGGAGTITYAAGSGASIANGTQTSGGIITAVTGYYADLEYLGNNIWIITGVL